MATDTWPASLPQYLLVNGFKETTDPKSMIKSKMATGPDKRRLRFTLPTGLFDGNIWITHYQKEIMDNFYNVELEQGVKSFNWVRPIEQTPIVFKFNSQPEYTPLGGVILLAKITLVEIPGA